MMETDIGLTPREIDVVRLIARDLSTKEIADELGITPRTVKIHRSNIYGKIGGGIARVTLYAVNAGLVTVSGNSLTADQIAKHDAVRAATSDALDKGKLGIASLIYNIPEDTLRLYAQGDDSALTESQIDWLAVDLKK